jgi:hypothetical protein
MSLIIVKLNQKLILRKLTQGSVGYDNKSKTESDVNVTHFDVDFDSSQTEIDSHFDDNNKRNNTINKSNYFSKENSDLSKNKNTFICDFVVCDKKNLIP